jgi:hypothetical protein
MIEGSSMETAETIRVLVTSTIMVLAIAFPMFMERGP